MQSISEWLLSLGLEQYATILADNDVDIDALRLLNEKDLQELGISLGHRKKLLKAIAELDDATANSTTATAQPLSTDTAERRNLTVMFCDLVGSTELSQKLDPETLRELMRVYQKTCGQIIEQYDGHVAQYLGDGLMTYFGWPRAHEDDAERAIRAALEIVEAVKHVKAPESLHVRIGIATGPVVVGETGSGDASVPKLAVGETPNVAARIQGLAGPDQVMIGPDTRHLIGGTFDLDDSGEHALKGIVKPVRAWSVTALASSKGRFDAAHGEELTPLVGREQEIALLMERWALAQDGEGQVVLFSGEPGIGKSRILSALREKLQSEGAKAMRFQCSPFYINSAFWPSIDNFERALKFARDETPESKLDKLESLIVGYYQRPLADVRFIASMLSIPCNARYGELAMTPQKFKDETLRTLVDLTEAAARKQPSALLFEDLHWADPTTLEVLDLMINRVQTIPLLIVLTHRPEFQNRWSNHGYVISLNLSKLTRAQSQAMVTKVTGAKALPPDLLEQILAKTDGVPLFVEELTTSILESGELMDAGDHYEYVGTAGSITIPATLRDSLMARLDRIMPVVKEIAQIGAAIGREFSHELVAAVAPLQKILLDDALGQLTDSGLVFRRGTPPDATYTFKHALVGDTAYDSLLNRDRQGLHKQIAEALIEDDPSVVETEPELLAHHYTAANLVDMAVPKWLAAGQLAVARFAHTEALGHLKSGLDLIEQLPESPDRDRTELAIHMAIASAYNATEGWGSDNTKAAYEKAEPIIGRLGDDENVFDMMIGIYYFYIIRGQMDKSEPVIRDALRYANKRGTSAQKLVAYQCLGQNNCWRGVFAEAVKSYETSMSFYDRTEHAFLANVWGADFYASDLAFLGSAYWLAGKPDQASLAVERALAHAESMEQTHIVAWTQTVCSMARLVQGEHDLAVTTAISAREKTRAIEMKLMEGFAWALGGAARILRGERDDGIAELESGLEMWTDLGGQGYVPWLSTILAVGYAQDGRFNEARTLFEDAVEQAASGGEIWSNASIEECRAKISLLAGDDRGAMKQFQKALRISEQLGSPSLALRMAIHIARLSEPKEVQAILAPHYDWFTEGFDTPDLKDAKALLAELK